MSYAWRKCEIECCNARVVAGGPYRYCSHHRPKLQRAHRPLTPEERDRDRSRRARQRAALGIPEWWTT